MVKLILRDDDCNFFTRPCDIERVYKSVPNIPISFAVVPTVSDVCGGCPETKGNTKPMWVGDNADLISFLKDWYRQGRCDILQHGITHGYHYNQKGGKIPEMVWRNNEPDLIDKIKEKKCYLEEVFDLPISCFVAPSNRILKKGIDAVVKNGMNYSGIIPIDFQRSFNLRSFNNYIKRMWIRATLKLPYPDILTYSTHKELNACNTINIDYLKRMFNYCQKLNSPMAINVHYWHMRDFPERYDGLWEFIEYALGQGAQPSRMRDCI